jgi:hypothetical protein
MDRLMLFDHIRLHCQIWCDDHQEIHLIIRHVIKEEERTQDVIGPQWCGFCAVTR